MERPLTVGSPTHRDSALVNGPVVLPAQQQEIVEAGSTARRIAMALSVGAVRELLDAS